ncbi:MAG: hypothetical protein KAH31_07250 [Candidatus Sabulitectum sp.]|nr:hypothetical protein [Candidatus Sabulitectum sp.]
MSEMVTVPGRLFSVISALLIFSLVLLFVPGCTSLTEYEMAYSGVLHVLSPADLSTIHTIPGITAARSLLLYQYGFLVTTTEGKVLSYTYDSYDLVGEYTVGLPSASGYHQIAYSSIEKTAYLIGSMGRILELSLPECSVLDEFHICESPVTIVIADGSNYIFVADGPSNQIYQVSIENNTAYTSVPVDFNINCIEPGQNPDSILVGTSGGINLLEILGPGSLRNTIQSEPVPCTALAAVPGDTIFVGVKGYPGDYSVGVVDVINSQVHNPTLPEYYGEVDLTGNSHFISLAVDSTHAFVLSSVGNTMSRLVSYNYSTFTMDQQTDLSGFPLALKVSEDGIIFVLTTE